MKRLTAAALSALCAFFLYAEPAETYYDDTHYGLTYLMARACGYNPEQAFRMASANVSVDYSSLTEPIQFGNEVAGDPDEARVRFHAFRDDRLLRHIRTRQAGSLNLVDLPQASPAEMYALRQQADAAIEIQSQHLWKLGLLDRNPGVFLHFLQDITSHAGYASSGGHWWMRNPTLGSEALTAASFGATTDYLSFSAAHTQKMVNETLTWLRGFMGQMSATQRLQHCNLAEIKTAVETLASVNPVPDVAVQYSSQVPVAGKRLEGTPNIARASSAIEMLLRARGELAPFRADPRRYTYSIAGRLASLSDADLDAFTLYGNVGVLINGAGSEPIEISIWTQQTRLDEVPYQLACETGTASARFENLPVGDLILQTVTKGRVVRRPLRLAGRRHTESLELLQHAPDAMQCDGRVLAVSTELCKLTSAGGQRMNRSKMESLERQLTSSFADPRVCRSRETTSTIATPTPRSLPPTPPPPAPRTEPEPEPKKKNPGLGMAQTLMWTAFGAGAGYLGLYLGEQSSQPKDCGSQPSQPSAFSPNYSTLFSQYISAMGDWCRCNGFSGFSGGVCR